MMTPAFRLRAGFAGLALATANACSAPTEGPRVATITTDISALTLYLGTGGGQSRQLVATPRDANGAAIEGRSVSWTSLTPGVASVTASGLVTALAIGSATIRVSSGSAEATVAVTVAPVPVADVSISIDSLFLQRSPLAAGSFPLGAQVRDSAGGPLFGRTILWQSSAPAVATVDATGLIRAVTDGVAIVRATVEGKSDSVVVTVSATDELPAGFDLAIADAKWTQGVQNEAGSIPMLAGGRAAVVNVLLSSPSELAVPDELELRLLDGDVVVWADTQQVTVSAGTPSLLAPSAQFLVPSTELQQGRLWQVRRDPRGQLADASAATDVFPAGSPQTLNLVLPPPLRILFVPISLSAHGGATGNVNTGNVEDYIRVVRRIAPVGAIQTAVATPFPTSTSFGTAPAGGGSDFWIPVLSQLDQARIASPTHADWHWVGVVVPPPGFNNTAFGGFGYIPNDGTSFGPSTRTSLVVQVGWFNYEPQTRELVIHELGHNFGRFHAPCGNPAGPDPSFPVSGGRIGDGAHDTWSFENGLTTSALPVPPSTGDVMGYCTPTWYGAYNYGGIVDFRGSAVVALMAGTPRGSVLYVSGEVDGSRATLHSARAMTAVPSAPDPTGDWIAEATDANGTVILRFPFSLARWDHEPGRRPIAVALPMSAALRATLVSLTVRGPDGAEATLRLENP